MAAEFRPVAPVDPTNLRPMLFLDVAREMMLGNGVAAAGVASPGRRGGGPKEGRTRIRC